MRARLGDAFLREFAKDAWRSLEPGVDVDASWNEYLDALCDHVQYLLEGWLEATGRLAREARRIRAVDWPRIQNLLVNMAPATLKSKIVMVIAPAWMWLRCPEWTVACLSGNPDNVTRDSLACRDLVKSAWYRRLILAAQARRGIEADAWTVRHDVDSVGKWETTARGARTSRGLQSSGVGLHVDAILCDDPDDAYRVYGEPERKATRGQWKAYGNRVNSLEHSVRVVVQQRVHVEDQSAYLLAEEGAWTPENTAGWVQFSVPVAFDERRACRTALGWSDPRRTRGEVMTPGRFTARVRASERRRLGPQGYRAQYDQAPESTEGGMFKRKWWRFYRGNGAGLERPAGCRTRAEVAARELPAKMDWVDVSLDATFGSLLAGASRVGLGVVAGLAAERFVLADRSRRMGGADEMTREVIALIEAYPEVRKVLVEKKALGVAVIEQLQNAIRSGATRAVEVVEVEPKGGKEARAAASQPEVAAGLVYLEDGAEWLVGGVDPDDSGFVGEVSAFPDGKNDDRVDYLTQALSHHASSQDVGRLKMLLKACR